jgi:hypothetical protein
MCVCVCVLPVCVCVCVPVCVCCLCVADRAASRSCIALASTSQDSGRRCVYVCVLAYWLMLECLVLCVLVALPCCTAASPTLDYLGRQGVRVCAYMCVRMRVCDVCVLCVCVRVRVMLVCVSAYMCVCVGAR